MNISRPFIERPVATTLLMIALLLTGIVGYRVLPVSALPEVDYPTIQVTTLYPGASPDVMTSGLAPGKRTGRAMVAGSVVLVFEVNRGWIPDRRMTAAGVVERFDPFEARAAGLVRSVEACPVDKL